MNACTTFGLFVFFLWGIPQRAYSYNIVGTFSRAQIDLRKTRKRALTTLDEELMSNEIAEPYLCAIKINGKNRGEEGTTPHL